MDVFIGLLLLASIAIFAISGILLLYYKYLKHNAEKQSKWKKFVIASLCSFALGIAYVAFFRVPTKPDKYANLSPQVRAERIHEDEIKEGITKICKGVLREDFISIQINADYSEKPGRGQKDQKVVLVTAKFGENFNDRYMRMGNTKTARNLAKALFTSKYNIGEMCLFMQIEELSSTGHKQKRNIMKFNMDKAAADRINWENADKVNLDDFLDNFEYWSIPQFRKK